ncbi:MAG: hypothetical protein ACK5LL_06095 [Suipraeoptans sp.]
MTITMNALKERMRKKQLYIVVVIGALLVALCGSGSTTISVQGEEISGFANTLMMFNVIVNAVGCLLALLLSMSTIPTEYDEKRSHLVWSKGISQSKYHFQLVIANVLSSLAAAAILYAAIGIFMITTGESSSLKYIVPAFLILSINVIMISALTSVLSVKLPAAVTGLIVGGVLLVGIGHSLIEMYATTLGGFSEKILNAILKVMPNLHEIQSQATLLVIGNGVDGKILLKGVVIIAIAFVGVLVIKRKEA